MSWWQVLTFQEGECFPEEGNRRTISSRPYYVYPEKLCDVETLASILLRGTDRKKLIWFQEEIPSGNCQEHNLTVEEIRKPIPILMGRSLG